MRDSSVVTIVNISYNTYTSSSDDGWEQTESLARAATVKQSIPE